MNIGILSIILFFSAGVIALTVSMLSSLEQHFMLKKMDKKLDELLRFKNFSEQNNSSGSTDNESSNI
jgi:hypothetical protein